MGWRREVEQVRGALDEAARVLEEHGGGETASLRRYRDDPIGFVRDVLGETDPGPWPAQVEIAEAVRDRPRVVVRGAHATGKDHILARLLLWWIFARDGTAIVTAASDRQVRNIVMKEVRAAFRKAADRLPGTLLTSELRLDEEARLLAFTGASVDTMTGYHDRQVLVAISEGQGEEVEARAYDAAFALATSEDSRILVVGNPVRRAGRFAEVSHAPNWHPIRVPASAHPNIRTGERVIPNGPDRAWVQSVAEEYGETSDWYRSRVEAEFPRRDITALVEDAWLDQAVALWRRLEDADAWAGPVTFGVDVARQGADASALAVYQQGAGVRRVVTWRGASTVTTADRVEAEADALTGVRPAVIVDVVGLGAGVHDTLAERGWGSRVTGFNASQRARDADRFANRRSEAAWAIRKALEAGQLALPDDPALLEEIAAHAWGVDATGRIILESKDDVRAKLRSSPDRFDAVAMAVWAGWSRRRLKGARLGSIPKTGSASGERTDRIRIGFGDPGGDERAALDSQGDGSRPALPIDRQNSNW